MERMVVGDERLGVAPPCTRGIQLQKTFHDAPDDWLKKAQARLPMGQLVKPHQIAPLIAYLLSPDSGIITGAIIDYDQQIIGAVPE